MALLPLYKVPYMVDAADAAGGGAGAEGTSLSAFAQVVLTQSINCSGVAGWGWASSNMFTICLFIVLVGIGANGRGGKGWK